MSSEKPLKERVLRPASRTSAPRAEKAASTGRNNVKNPASQNRNLRARERTRRKLLDAAYRVMARVGVDATTINQVTEEADLGFGSFYNYFSSKEEIARTVFHDQLAAFSDRMDEMNAGIEDASVRLSRNMLRILHKTRQDPVWGWFFVNAEFALQELRTVFWAPNQRNLKQGLEQGSYRFDASSLTLSDVVFGSMLAVMRSILEGRASPTAEAETVEIMMILLGVPAERARALSAQTLPEE